MRKVIMLTFSISGLLMLASCDPQTCGTDFVENHSSGTIYLRNTDSVIVDTLAAGQARSFEPVCGLGEGTAPSAGFQYSCVTNDSAVCKKDIQDFRSWNTAKVEKYKWTHRFTVTDADF